MWRPGHHVYVVGNSHSQVEPKYPLPSMNITESFKSSFRFFLHLNFTDYQKIPFVKLGMFSLFI